MTREQAIEFMWIENHKNPVVIKWQHHKTIRDLVEKLIHKIFDDFDAQLKAKDEEIERLFGLIKSLWQIIDDIDTYGDMAKSDDALFRSFVEKKQKERWKLPITTDGYEIILKDNACTLKQKTNL